MNSKIITRKKFFNKIALRTDEQLDAPHTFKQTAQDAAKAREVFIATMEPILSFVPVLGEGIGIYQGSKMLMEAKDKWDYIGGALILGLSLVGLKVLMPSKSALLTTLKLAREGNVAEIKKLISILKGAKISDHINEIKQAIGNRLNLSGLEEKIRAAETEMQRAATQFEGEAAKETGQAAQAAQAVKETGEAAGQVAFKQFNSGRVLVNFEGSTELLYQYKAQIDMAGGMLNAKGFGNLWTGGINVVNKIDGCSLITQGAYAYWTDIVQLSSKILEKRSPERIAYFLLHELGHRHWFKFMSESQRAKFTSLVNFKSIYQTSGDAVKALPAHARFYELMSFERGKSNTLTNMNWLTSTLAPTNLDEASQALTKIYKDMSNDDFINVLKNLYPEKTNKFMKETLVSMRQSQVSWVANPHTIATNVDDLFNKFFSSFAKNEIDSIDAGIKALAKNNVKPIEAVSQYGSTMDVEAYAEAFAHYITGGAMNREQLDFFKAIVNEYKTVVNNSNIFNLIKLSNIYFSICKD